MLGFNHAFFVTAGDEHQRAVVLGHIIQKYRDVHCAFGRHMVIVQPGTVVLVPLPDVTLKGHLAVDFELVHVQLLTEQAFNRLNHARVPGQLGKRFAVHVGGKVGAHRVFAFFTHVVVLAA